MDICIIGTGYVGLVTGTCFAKLGHSVRCVDIDEEKVRRINAGDPPIFEKGLKPLLEEVLASGRFRATLDLKDAVNRTDMAFISVPTPSREDGSIDLRFVRAVGGQLGDVLRNDAKDYCVIMKSTVVPGTTGELARILEEHAGRRIPVGMNPEFLKEGVAIEDFLHPDRIVLGADDPQVMEKLRGVYSSLNAPKLETTTCTAEMIKYASNAFLATKISFINEVGNACKELGIDSYVVAEGMGLDSRISPRFLASGMGFGGSCFPKDVAALRAKVRELGLASHVLDAVLRVNEEQPLRMVALAKKHMGLKGVPVSVLGLAFKNGTDDMRESRSIPLINALLEEGAVVKAYDPQAEENAKKIFGERITYCSSSKECVDGTKVCFIATDWPGFKDEALYRDLLVIDGRNMFRREEDYEGITW